MGQSETAISLIAMILNNVKDADAQLEMVRKVIEMIGFRCIEA